MLRPLVIYSTSVDFHDFTSQLIDWVVSGGLELLRTDVDPVSLDNPPPPSAQLSILVRVSWLEAHHHAYHSLSLSTKNRAQNGPGASFLEGVSKTELSFQ